jgi:hypothetical protein
MVDPISAGIVLLILGVIPLALIGLGIWALRKKPTYRRPALVLIVGAVLLLSGILVPAVFRARPILVDELLFVLVFFLGPVLLLVAAVWTVICAAHKVA